MIDLQAGFVDGLFIYYGSFRQLQRVILALAVIGPRRQRKSSDALWILSGIGEFIVTYQRVFLIDFQIAANTEVGSHIGRNQSLVE